MLDYSEPVAVLMFAVLHLMTGDDDPHEIVRAFTAPLVPGSPVAVSPRLDDAPLSFYGGVALVPREER